MKLVSNHLRYSTVYTYGHVQLAYLSRRFSCVSCSISAVAWALSFQLSSGSLGTVSNEDGGNNSGCFFPGQWRLNWNHIWLPFACKTWIITLGLCKQMGSLLMCVNGYCHLPVRLIVKGMSSRQCAHHCNMITHAATHTIWKMAISIRGQRHTSDSAGWMYTCLLRVWTISGQMCQWVWSRFV